MLWPDATALRCSELFVEAFAITREVYLHSIPADARTAVEKVEDLLKRPKLTQVLVAWGNGSPLIQ
jgi:hypothetical protein